MSLDRHQAHRVCLVQALGFIHQYRQSLHPSFLVQAKYRLEVAREWAPDSGSLRRATRLLENEMACVQDMLAFPEARPARPRVAGWAVAVLVAVSTVTAFISVWP